MCWRGRSRKETKMVDDVDGAEILGSPTPSDAARLAEIEQIKDASMQH